VQGAMLELLAIFVQCEGIVCVTLNVYSLFQED
jgi:hypothetical protein